MTVRINKVAFKVKGGPTQIKNFAGIQSKYDAEKGLSAANKREIRQIAAQQYKCTESDIMFSDEFEPPKPETEKDETKETGDTKETGGSGTKEKTETGKGDK